MNFNIMHPADQIVTIMDRIYNYGMTTTSGGNLSIRDENGDVWISPSGVDKGTLRREDIVCVKPDGTIIGIHKPSIELPFHLDVYKIRPDVNAVLHAHPPALVSFSIVRKIPNTHIIPNASLICGEIQMAPYAVPGGALLGEYISEVFKKGINVVMMENHGVVIAGKDLFAAFMSFETLDFCARLEINAARLGTPKPLSDKYIEISKQKNDAELGKFETVVHTSLEKEARAKMCTLIRRSYDQKLFTSTQGTFSQRISEDSFIITPYNKDRKYLQPDDLVLVKGGKVEADKKPSRSVLLHKEIYDTHSDINSIIIAHPPKIMAFAITDAKFDSLTIPESYIMLRGVPKFPFGSSFLQPKLIAKEFCPAVPVILVENDCVIVTGSSLLNAFDRLEVLEYSAKAILDAEEIGEIMNISEEERKIINVEFGLND